MAFSSAAIMRLASCISSLTKCVRCRGSIYRCLPVGVPGRQRYWLTPRCRSHCSTPLWDSRVVCSTMVREAQLLFKASETEGLQGRKGGNNWVVQHRHIPRPWNPTRACGIIRTIEVHDPESHRGRVHFI